MPRGVKVAHLWIQDCGVEACASTGRWHYHRLNPRSQAVKNVEMTVRRSLSLIKAFDDLVAQGKDWQSISTTTWREVFGLVSPSTEATLLELWERYKKGTLQSQTLDLAENLVMEDLTAEARKEISNGLSQLRNRRVTRSGVKRASPHARSR